MKDQRHWAPACAGATDRSFVPASSLRRYRASAFAGATEPLQRLRWLGLVGLCLASAAAQAGGPLSVCKGQGVRYPAGATVNLNYDLGPLGSRGKAQADALLTTAISLWPNVATASVALGRGADLPENVTTANLGKYWDQSGNGLNPLIYDSDGSIVDLLLGVGAKRNVLGFAGSSYYLSSCEYMRGRAVLNGSIAISDTELQTTVAHEIGHLIGLDHTQLDAAQGLARSNFPLMYPILHRASLSLHEDDVAAVSALYPSPLLASSYGRLSGTLKANGAAVLGANIWAREVDTGRTYSVVSDFLKQGSGHFSLLLPPGTYQLQAGAISTQFIGGSSIGPYSETLSDRSFQAPLYNAGVAMSPVALGGSSPNRFAIRAGCVADATFGLDGGGSISGNCGVPALATKADVRTFLPAAAAAGGYASYLRVINTGSVASPVSVALIDAATGLAGAPGELIGSLPAGAAMILSAAQVEAALGTTLAAAERPRIRVGALAAAAIETQSFLMQPGGVYNEVSPAQSGATVAVRTYLPAAAAPSGYQSFLRVINTGASATAVTVAKIDGASGQAGAAALLNPSLPAGAAVTYAAAQVEAALGQAMTAAERPRLLLAAPASTLEAQSFLLQPGGAYNEISSGQSGSAVEVRSYLPAAVAGYTTFVRVINHGSTASPVVAALLDDASGAPLASGTLIAALPAAAALTLSSAEIEARLGVAVAAGSRPRLRLSAASDLAVQSFLLQPGGAYNEISNALRGNPVTVRTYLPAAAAASGYTSYLRVINTGSVPTAVNGALVDADSGAAGNPRTLVATLPAGAAITLSSSQIETALGTTVAAGARPRIRISGSTVLEVQSFLTQPGGAYTEVSAGQ